MKKLLIIFVVFISLFISSCSDTDVVGEVSVDSIRQISSLYETNMNNSQVVRCHYIENLMGLLGQPYEVVTSEDGAISEYVYAISDFEGHFIRFTYFNAADIIESDYELNSELVGISILKDGVAYYNKSATVLSGGADSSHYQGSNRTFAELEWESFWDEVADHVGKTERVSLKIFNDQPSESQTSHPFCEQVFLGEDFFDVQYFLGEPENLTRIGNIGFIAEYSFDSNSRIDLFFAYENVLLDKYIPCGSDIYCADLSMAFLCTDESGEPIYERIHIGDSGLDMTSTELWGTEHSVEDRVIHPLYTSVYELYNDLGTPHKTLNYPNNLIYVYENSFGDTLYYIVQKGDSGVIAFSGNLSDLQSADNVATENNRDISDEIRELFGEIESSDIEIRSNYSFAYIYSKLGLPAVSYAKQSSGTSILKYYHDGEFLTITDSMN